MRRRRHPLDDLEAEIRDHLEREVADQVAAGVPPAAARRAARRRFGNPALVREDARAVWVPLWLDQLRQDLRFGARSLRRNPGFALAAILTLALGIGATTAVFSVVRGVLLEPPPYPRPDRVVTIWETHAGRGVTRGIVAPANFAAWRDRQRSFAHVGLIEPTRLGVVVDGLPAEVRALRVSSEAFAALAVRPALGRLYTAAEDLRGEDDVVVLSHEFWRTRLGGRPDVVGTALDTVDGPRTIVGVMPAGFAIEGWQAVCFVPYGWTLEELLAAPGRGYSHGVARLRDGVSLAQARDEMRAIARRLERVAPERNAGWSAAVVPIQRVTVEGVAPVLWVLAGAVVLVLLVACVNIANLLLARGTARGRELGLRAALGAERRRLLRQMLTESVLLAVCGGLAGLGLAVALQRGLVALAAERIAPAQLDRVALDAGAVAFALAVALGAGVLFGLLPALLASAGARDANAARNDGGRGARRGLSGLVVAEVALSLVLLAGAGLLVRSLLRLQDVDPGFRAAGVLTARVGLPAARYPDGAAVTAFLDRALDRIRALPGVRDAAGISFLPFGGPGIATGFHRLDAPPPTAGEEATADVRPVTPGYFRTLGIPRLAGRDFTAADGADAAPVAVVSAELVRTAFPGEDPLGRRIHVAVGPAEGVVARIVGVVGDSKFSALDATTRPAVYLPQAQLSFGLLSFVVRTDGDPLALAGDLGAAVREIDPALPVADVAPLDRVVGETLARPRAVSAVLSAFALLALLLAAVGVYGVMAYSVARRTREIAVRMALGATAGSVLGRVLGEALRLVLAGVAAGLLAAAALTRLLGRLLFETAPLDAPTFAGTALVLLAVAALAAYLPARRGARVAPARALRAE